MVRRQLPTAVLLSTLLALGVTAGVLAKDGAIVTLDSSLPSDPDPGSEIIVGWTVQVAGQGGQLEPFNAEAMFVRLVPASGEPIEVVGRQDPPGHYVATVTVPAGGIRDVVFGLRGESCSGGTCQPSDILFAVDDSVVPVFAPAGAQAASEPNAPAAPDGTAPSVGVSGDPQSLGFVGLALAAAAIVVAAVVLRARGRDLTPGSSRS